MVSTLVIALPAPVPVASATSSILPILPADATSTASPLAGSGPPARRTTVISPWTSGKTLESWGFRGACVTTKQSYHTDYSMSFSVSLPLARILGSYALTGCLSLRSTPLCRNSFTFRYPSYFAVARIVDEDHPFIMACLFGDIESVRFMLRSGEGRPTDVTAKGKTPLFFAAASGSIEVVAELLECGVEVDAIVDSKGMSTMLIISSRDKHLDLVRFLLHQGASADNVDSVGIGACAACWFNDDLSTTHSSMDIHNVLSESTHFDLHLDVDDRSLAVALAAMHGCGSQIDALVRFGHDIHEGSLGAADSMCFAAHHGNYSSYSALVSHYGGEVFENDMDNIIVKLLQVTILGKARHPVEYPDLISGHDEILRNTLQRCGKDRLLSVTIYGDGHSGEDPRISVLLGKQMKLSELAAALGPETEEWYLGMVRNCGFLNVDEESEVMQRLRELRLAGHVTTGLIYEVEQETGESGGYRGCESEDCNEDSALSREGIEEPDTGVNDGCESSTESEADQFWDAPESV